MISSMHLSNQPTNAGFPAVSYFTTVTFPRHANVTIHHYSAEGNDLLITGIVRFDPRPSRAFIKSFCLAFAWSCTSCTRNVFTL